MIPAFSHAHILPPFNSAAGPAVPQGRSPYAATSEELVLRFGTSPQRRGILQELLAYRAVLRGAGIVSGFQWLDGSFVEDCEASRGSPPNDIDLVTFAHRPVGARDQAGWIAFVNANLGLFRPTGGLLDAYYVDLSGDDSFLVEQASYWLGLFSHQRGVGTWKGMVKLDLAGDDTAAIALLGVGP